MQAARAARIVLAMIGIKRRLALNHHRLSARGREVPPRAIMS